MCAEGLQNIVKNYQDSWFPGWDLNWALPNTRNKHCFLNQSYLICGRCQGIKYVYLNLFIHLFVEWFVVYCSEWLDCQPVMNWKDYVRKWSKHLPGWCKIPTKKPQCSVCVPNESCEIWTQTQIAAIMKVVKLLLLFHPEGGENFTPSVTVCDDKDFVICVVWRLFLQQLVSECQIPDNKAVNCSCFHGSLHPTTPISTLTIYNFLRATQRLYDIDGPQAAINYMLPFLYNFPSQLLIPLSYVLLQIYHEIAKTLLL